MTAASPRTAFIDHLRVLATCLVILHHTAIAYGGSGGWYWREQPNASQLPLLFFNAVNQSWFMGFFFLLAGYYTPRAFERKGPGRFLADRFVRLSIPLAVYFLVLSPLTIALARCGDGHPFWSGWALMIREHEFEPGPLWFAEALLLLALAYVLWRRIRPTGAGDLAAWPAARTLLVAALAVAAVSFAVRLAVPVGRNVLWLQLGYFPPYLLLFAFGCLAARHELLARVEFSTVRPWLFVSLVTLALLPVLIVTRSGKGAFEGGASFNALSYALWDPLAAWGIMLGLLWWFRTRLGGSGAFTDGAARSAYGAYIVHPPVVVGLGLLAHDWTLAPLLKFIVVGSLACAVAFALARALLLLPGASRVL